MADFTLPSLGENVTAGDVLRVLVKPGDTIAKDQAVLELETDKATIEVPSSVAGVVKDVQIKAGQKIKVGQVILTVEGDGGGAKPAASKSDNADQADKPKAQPAGAPEEGGLSQRASADENRASSGSAAGRADREGSKDGKADPPDAQRATPPDEA